MKYLHKHSETLILNMKKVNNSNKNKQTNIRSEQIIFQNLTHRSDSQMQDQSQSELPSPIVQASLKKSRRKTLTQKLQSLEQSRSISSKDDDSILKNLDKNQENNDYKVTQSIHIQRELHPADNKFDVLADPLRNDNNNQSTDADMTLSGKNNLNAKKPPLNCQPQIQEMQQSVFLDEDIVRSSLILARYQMNVNNSSLEKVDTLLANKTSEKNQIKDSKNSMKGSMRSSINKMIANRDWAPVKIPHDIFEDEELMSEVPKEAPKAQNKQIKSQVKVNLVERSHQKQQNTNMNIFPNIHQNLHQNFPMLNTWHASSQNNQGFQSQQNNFLHPQSNNTYQRMSMQQMHPNQSVNQNIMNSYQPQNFNPQMQYSHAVHYAQNIQNHPPSPRSETCWNPPQNHYQPYPFLSGLEIISEVRDLRREIKMLKNCWMEERVEKLHQRYNSEFSRDRKGSEDLEKTINHQFDVKLLLEHQQTIYQNRLKQIEQKFFEQIEKLEREQKFLKEENQSLKKGWMFRHTGSFDLNSIEQVPKTFRQSQKKKSQLDLLQNSKFNRTQELLKEKLSIKRKESPVKIFKLKRENSRTKSNKAGKKDKTKF